MKNLYDELKEVALNPTGSRLSWTGSKLDHLIFGIRLPGFFLNQKPLILENKSAIEKIVEQQRLQGLTKSYEMVALQMHEMSLSENFPEIRRSQKEFEVYLLRPVRKATPEEVSACQKYIANLRQKGVKIWDPADTPQKDNVGGFTIVENHFYEIWAAKRMDCYWNGSTGSHVDLGTALVKHFNEEMPITTFNRQEMIDKGTFPTLEPANVEELILYLDDLAYIPEISSKK